MKDQRIDKHMKKRDDAQAKKLSSSSRRFGAGKGAPGASWVGNLK